MKVKDGKLELGKNDLQVGNFVVSLSKDGQKITVQDIGSVHSYTIDTKTPKGLYLKYLYDDKADAALHNCIAVTFNALMCVPDLDFFEAIDKESVACVGRHPELYGVFKTDESEEDILNEQKELLDLMDKVEKEGLVS